MIGIDICEVKRFEKLVKDHSFLSRVFTEAEIEYCIKKKNCCQNFAVRFAAKEAFSKALGTGLKSGIKLKEIEILKDDEGKPIIKLYDKTKLFYESRFNKNIHLSLSHEKSLAVAVVILL